MMPTTTSQIIQPKKKSVCVCEKKERTSKDFTKKVNNQ